VQAYLLDWANLLVRWVHVITGIAWIGASLYFVFLDNSLEKPENPADAAKGVAGELWAVHGGGFYHAQKYAAAPPAMPETLHWFKWEAYWTWMSGFTLLVLSYYLAADLYLVDKTVMNLSSGAAVGLGLVWLVSGWIVYDLLCKSPLGRNDAALGVVVFVLLALAAWGLTRTFSGRGAYIHYGAILGTIMVANVVMVIIPGQRKWVRALAEGRAPDPTTGAKAKQRSVHNTYFTLPVLFVMISNHYAMTFGSAWNWLVLIGFTAAGALIRVWFVLRHKGNASPVPVVAGALILLAVAALIAPRAGKDAGGVTLAQVKQVIDARCVTCHSEKPTFQGFAQPPKGVMLDTAERIQAMKLQIHQQAVLAKAMPPGNLTGITDEERQLIDRWFQAGAKSE
jgi:uncharacterized membrane protein